MGLVYFMDGILSDQNTIWQVLTAAHQAKLTGTLMLTCDNQLCQAQWQRGELIALIWRNLKGQAALDRLLQLRHGQYRFVENLTRAAPQPDLPATRDLLTRSPANTPTPTEAVGTIPAVVEEAITLPPEVTPVATIQPDLVEPLINAAVPASKPDLNRQTLQKIYAVLLAEIGKRAGEVMMLTADAQDLSAQFKAGTLPREQARAWLVQVAQSIPDPLHRTAFVQRAIEIAEL